MLHLDPRSIGDSVQFGFCGFAIGITMHFSGSKLSVWKNFKSFVLLVFFFGKTFRCFFWYLIFWVEILFLSNLLCELFIIFTFFSLCYLIIYSLLNVYWTYLPFFAFLFHRISFIVQISACLKSILVQSALEDLYSVVPAVESDRLSVSWNP